MRSVRRRVRCLRKGHYWLQRLDSHGDVAQFCRRCGRRGLAADDRIQMGAEQLNARISVN